MLTILVCGVIAHPPGKKYSDISLGPTTPSIRTTYSTMTTRADQQAILRILGAVNTGTGDSSQVLDSLRL